MQKTMVYLCTRITDTVKNVLVNIHDMPYFVTACILSHNLKFSCWFVCFLNLTLLILMRPLSFHIIFNANKA